jgi:hypothetical protein
MVGLAFGLSAAGVGGGLLVAARGFGALYLAGALAVFTAAALLLGLLGRRPRAKPVGPAVGATNA